MSTPQLTRTASVTVELGLDIPDETETTARNAFTDVLEGHGRTDTRLHIRIISDHDPDRARPILARVLIDGRDAVHLEATTPDEAIQALAGRLGEWFDGPGR